MEMTTRYHIRQWLDESDGFANANLLYKYSLQSKELVLKIEQRAKVSLAGEKSILKLLSVIISGVQIQSGEILESEQGLSLYKIHPLSDAPGLILDIWGKKEISFKCTKIDITEIKEIEEIAKPVLSKDTLMFKIKVGEKPSADYWIKQLREKGHEAMYIDYFGDDLPTDKILDYAGISIGPKSTIDHLRLGVKFCKVSYADGVMELIIELQNTELQDFWKNFIRIISEMEILQVRSGNVIFTRTEWLNFLENERLPQRLL